jgi:mannose-6-phosphate isomerase
MSAPPLPVVFRPIFKRKPWGGRNLEKVFGKPLPPGQAIGESWELSPLASDESEVASGPFAGLRLSELVSNWGERLYGDRFPEDALFPLLIKFLDARENLSVQVHPLPTGKTDADRNVKHEAWYVIDAEPGAELFLGLVEGATPEQLARAADSDRIVELLRRWRVRTGDAFYLPSGIVHALGAGIVVAEVQNPADVTYRLYDWDRREVDGRPRELHVPQALRNVRWNVSEEEIVQPRRPVAGTFPGATRLVTCAAFSIDLVRLVPGLGRMIPHGRMVVWIILRGEFWARRGPYEMRWRAGDVVLVPADHRDLTLEVAAPCDLLEVSAGPAS